MARLLIIEDNVPLATLLSTAAGQRGHEVSAVHTGKAGLATAAWAPPDLALVDLLLPDMRGVLLLEQLRERGIPCIAMSGVFKGDRFAQDAVARHGALEFFEKPFDLGTLLDAVERHVGAPELGFDVDLDEPEEELAELQLELSEIVEPQDPGNGPVRHQDGSSTDPALEAALAAAELEEIVTGELLPDAGTATVDADPARVELQDVAEGTPAPSRGETPATDEASFADLDFDSPDSARPTAETPVISEAALVDPALGAPGAPSNPTGAAEDGAIPADQPGGLSPTSESDEASFADLDWDAPARIGSDADAPAADEASFAGPGFDAPDAAHAASSTHAGSGEEDFSDLGFDAPDAAHAASSTNAGEEDFSDLGFDAPEAAHASATTDPEAAPALPTEDVHAPFASRDGVWTSERPALPGRRRNRAGALVHRGSLADGALFGMLNAAHQSGFSGDLRLIEGEARKTLSFDHGRVQRATSSLDEERFGAFCVRSGALEEAQLERAAELVEREGLKTGEALLRLELLTPATRNELLARQVKEILWSTFAWERGTFELVPRKEPRADAEPLSLSTAALVMEGLVREGTLEALRRVLPPDTRLTPTSDPPYELGDLQLSGPQAHALAHSDGSKRVTDLLALTDLEERELLATLHGLVKLGILEPRAAAPASRRITFGL